MSDDLEDEVNVVIDFTHNLSLIRYINSMMVPVRLTIRAGVYPSETAEEINFDLTFAKIKYWFGVTVSDSIAFCRSNPLAVGMLLTNDGKQRLHNRLMITPCEPTDEHLAVLFQSKLQAISNDTMNFSYVRIETKANGLVFTYVGDWQVDLPAMEDWFDTKPYYFNVPWWQRDDVSTMDILAADADPNQSPPWAYGFDFIENAYNPQQLDNVVRGTFKPKIIRGGRTDD